MGTSYKICKVVNKWAKHMALDTRGPKRPASEICAELRQTPVDRLLQRSQAHITKVQTFKTTTTTFQTETKSILSVNLEETISIFSEETFTGLQRSTRWQDNAPPVGVKIQSHRVISRHHLVQFFCNPYEIFLPRHRCIYSSKNESIVSSRFLLETLKNLRNLAKTNVWIR